MNKIKVLVVDDSFVMRRIIESIIKQDSELELVGTARNGEEAVRFTKELSPDVITMDIEMPKMSGLEALDIIMKEKPTPVIMVSSLTHDGAEATIKALSLGAVDFIPKQMLNDDVNSTSGIATDFLKRLKRFGSNKATLVRLMMTARSAKPASSISSTKPSSLIKPAPSTKPVLSGTVNTATALKDTPVTDSSKRVVVSRSSHKRIVAIGVSTGGPQSLQRVIPFLPEDLGVPVVITQHMPAEFTASLAKHLDVSSKLKVVECADKMKLEPNVVYIAKGGIHLKFVKVSNNVYIELSPEPSTVFNIPSVDVMISSLVGIYGSSCMGVIMTGMGSDGAKGLKELKASNGLVLAQDEASCVVYGMPRSVVKEGTADEIVPLDEIASRIVFHCKG